MRRILIPSSHACDDDDAHLQTLSLTKTRMRMKKKSLKSPSYDASYASCARLPIQSLKKMRTRRKSSRRMMIQIPSSLHLLTRLRRKMMKTKTRMSSIWPSCAPCDVSCDGACARVQTRSCWMRMKKRKMKRTRMSQILPCDDGDVHVRPPIPSCCLKMRTKRKRMMIQIPPSYDVHAQPRIQSCSTMKRKKRKTSSMSLVPCAPSCDACDDGFPRLGEQSARSQQR